MSQKSDPTQLFNSSPGEPSSPQGSTPSNGQPPLATRLVLQFESGKRVPVQLTHDQTITVGRSDEGEPAEVGLNLAPYGAAQNGVSRVHAAFSCRDGVYYIEDLNSTNGTRINGFQIVPNRAYRLRDGDELEFGRARLVVRLVRSIR